MRTTHRGRAFSTLSTRIAMTAVFLSASASVGAQSAAEPDDPPSRAARLGALAGSVSYQPSGADTWSDATLNYTITSGSRLYTGAASRAELDVGSLAIRLSESVDFIMTSLTDHLVQIGVGSGTVRVAVYRLPAGDTIEVDTPNGALTIDAPGQYRIDVSPEDISTVVAVERGRLDATGSGFSEVLATGQVVRLGGTDPVVVSAAGRPAQTAFDTWSLGRDQRVATLPQTQYVNPDIPGSADLYQYGRWNTEPTYGVVWYPGGVEPGWIPYRFGHWAWIEPWGWVWVENEPWGFAPFHFGRWVLIRNVWAWVPGPYPMRPYYAPALVVFVGGRGFSVAMGIEVQAWFPLGPREPFFPWYHHRDAYLRGVNAANLRDAGDLDALVHRRNFASIRYANRDAALTVVKTSIFNAGLPVAPSVMHPAAQAAARGEIIGHPSTVPAPIAEFGGRAPTNPRVAPRPPMVVAPPRAAPPRAEPPKAAPPKAAPAQPVTPPTRTVPPTRVTPAQPPPVKVTPAQPPPSAPPPARGVQTRPQVSVPQRPLIVRTPPAAQNPPFPAREKGMQQDPGRPLEPQQIKDIRAGKPVSPPRDPQSPAAAPANPKAEPSKPSKPAKPPKPPKP